MPDWLNFWTPVDIYYKFNENINSFLIRYETIDYSDYMLSKIARISTAKQILGYESIFIIQDFLVNFHSICNESDYLIDKNQSV